MGKLRHRSLTLNLQALAVVWEWEGLLTADLWTLSHGAAWHCHLSGPPGSAQKYWGGADRYGVARLQRFPGGWREPWSLSTESRVLGHGGDGRGQSQEEQCGPPPLPVEEDVPEVGPR